ncbi:MAG: hypothetical protein ACRDPE_03725 [Solirubrobacterales bacterium]
MFGDAEIGVPVFVHELARAEAARSGDSVWLDHGEWAAVVLDPRAPGPVGSHRG